MTNIVVFAPPATQEDDVLLRTRWIADRTVEQLHSLGMQTESVLDEAATRAGLERAITDNTSGVALFSHGRKAYIGMDVTSGQRIVQDDAVMGTDGPALDADNVAILSGKWGHAIACYAGEELGARACLEENGAECFVGYDVALEVKWQPGQLPAAIVPMFIDLVTRTTCNLAEGIRGHRALIHSVNDVADKIRIWCLDHPEQAQGLGLEVTLSQFVKRLKYYSRQQRPADQRTESK